MLYFALWGKDAQNILNSHLAAVQLAILICFGSALSTNFPLAARPNSGAFSEHSCICELQGQRV